MHPKNSMASHLTIATLLAGCATLLPAQLAQTSNSVTIPASSVVNPGDLGVRSHSNVRILGPGAMTGEPQAGGPPFSGYAYHTPASIACIYGFAHFEPGCNPNVVTANPTGGSRAIAIVDAYDDPNALADLQAFSAQFGLTSVSGSNFHVVYAPPGGAAPGSCVGSGTQPANAGIYGWDVEESLDVQWAHAMAPGAKIYLVEAQSNFNTDLYCAVSVASKLVAAAGGGEVSMSWGGSEYAAEGTVDTIFTTPKVVYFGATGDSPGTIYPSVSPNVVAVGGTSLSMNATTGNFEFENTWQEAGGGPSIYEPRPAFQNSIAEFVGAQRGVPDVAAVANLNTGVWVADSVVYGPGTWYVVGGTSVATPVWAGVVNRAGGFSRSSAEELTKIYSRYSEFIGFNDVEYGTCGPYMAYFSFPGWDFCTGQGSPAGYASK
jgi:kumamolisin